MTIVMIMKMTKKKMVIVMVFYLVARLDLLDLRDRLRANLLQARGGIRFVKENTRYVCQSKPGTWNT